jgi:hypothetical protein
MELTDSFHRRLFLPDNWKLDFCYWYVNRHIEGPPDQTNVLDRSSTYGTVQASCLRNLSLTCPQGILGSMVQAFYAWRVKILTNNVVIVAIILTCSTASFRRLHSYFYMLTFDTHSVMGIATSMAIGLIPRFLEFQRFKVVVIICTLNTT